MWLNPCLYYFLRFSWPACHPAGRPGLLFQLIFSLLVWAAPALRVGADQLVYRCLANTGVTPGWGEGVCSLHTSPAGNNRFFCNNESGRIGFHATDSLFSGACLLAERTEQAQESVRFEFIRIPEARLGDDLYDLLMPPAPEGSEQKSSAGTQEETGQYWQGGDDEAPDDQNHRPFPYRGYYPILSVSGGWLSRGEVSLAELLQIFRLPFALLNRGDLPLRPTVRYGEWLEHNVFVEYLLISHASGSQLYVHREQDPGWKPVQQNSHVQNQDQDPDDPRWMSMAKQSAILSGKKETDRLLSAVLDDLQERLPASSHNVPYQSVPRQMAEPPLSDDYSVPLHYISEPATEPAHPPVVTLADKPPDRDTTLFSNNQQSRATQEGGATGGAGPGLSGGGGGQEGEEAGGEGERSLADGTQVQLETWELKTAVEGLVVRGPLRTYESCHQCQHCKYFIISASPEDEQVHLRPTITQTQCGYYVCSDACHTEHQSTCRECQQGKGFNDVAVRRRVIESIRQKKLTIYYQGKGGEYEQIIPKYVPGPPEVLRLDIDTRPRQVESLPALGQRVLVLEQLVQALKKEIDVLKQENAGLRKTVQQSHRAALASLPVSSSTSAISGSKMLPAEKLTQLNEIVTTLVADVERHNGQLAQMQISVDHLSQVVPQYETKLTEMDLKIEILEVKSSNGIYVWKINELGRRYRDARTGRTTSLYSPPFYSSNHGYRLCLRAYLYGDGSGKGTHISLFIVLMKSEYDDILSWPFRQRVTLSLINQDHPLSAEAAIMRKFVPNPESTSFQKPRDTFNIASGFPEFAELSIMNDLSFVKGDTIYFRVKLDSPDTPTGPDNINH